MQLGPLQYALLVTTLLGTIPIVVWLVWFPDILDAYVEQAYGPALQEKYGFKVTEVTVTRSDGETFRRKVVTEIAPGGPLAQAGVRPGDSAWGYHRGGMPLFYSHLRELETKPEVTFPVSNVYDYAEGRSSKRDITVRH
jgi:hypothetical protein